MKKQFIRPSLKPAMRVISTLVCAMIILSPSGLLAGGLPTGGVVKKGAVAISTNGNTMTIDQATQRAIVHWDTFNIGAGNVVNVNQPNAQSAMLSRVVGGSASEILGRLSATGHFYLINPHGVLIGKDAIIDVNALIASTLNISDDNFMADKLIFEGSSDASVQNFGQINADAAALIAKNVVNAGEINARQVGLLGTQSVELGNFNGGKLTVDFSALADSAKAPTTVDNTGIINATKEGDVILFADAGISSNETGTIIADTLEISGAKVNIFNVGTLDINSLLIDPNGYLRISHGAPSGVTPAQFLTTDNLLVTDGDMTNLMTSAGGAHVNIMYHSFDIDGASGAVSVAGSNVQNLTLRAAGGTGPFNFLTSNASFSYTGGGELILEVANFIGLTGTGSISSEGNVTVQGGTAGKTMNLPGITAGGNLTVTSNNEDIIQAGKALNITGTTNLTAPGGKNIILGNTANAMGTIVVTASGASNLNDLTLASTRDTTLNLEQAKTLDGALTVDVANNASLTINNVIGNLITVAGNIDLDAAGALIVHPALTSTNGSIDLKAGGTATFDRALTANNGAITIDADGGITTAAAAALTAGNDVTIRSTAGNVIINSTVTTNTGNLVVTADAGAIDLREKLTVPGTTTLTAGGNITANDAANALTGAITIGGGKDVTLRNTLDTDLILPTTIGGNLTVNVTGGTNYLTIADVIGGVEAAGNINLTAAGVISTDSALTSTNGYISLNAGINAEINKALTANGDPNGAITIKAASNITTAAGAALLANGNVTIHSTGGGTIDINSNVTSTAGSIDVDADAGMLFIRDAIFTANADGADIMLNSAQSMRLDNVTLSGDDDIWLHTTGGGGLDGDIWLFDSAITSNSGSVDVYSSHANSWIFMGDASSSSTITAKKTVTISAHDRIVALNITAGGDILLDVRGVGIHVGGCLDVIGPVSSTPDAGNAGNVYLTAHDMYIEADVTTTAGDIYLYDYDQGFTLGDGGGGLNLSAEEIAHLQADSAHALIIGRGKTYAPPAFPFNIYTGIGSISSGFSTTTTDIVQFSDATAGSQNVGLITGGAITRLNDAYLTALADGSLALVANKGIFFGAIAADGSPLELAALNRDFPAAATHDIILFLGGLETGRTYNVASFDDGADPVATGLGMNVAGLRNEADGEDIVVCVPAAGNTVGINAPVIGTADGTQNDIVFYMKGSDLKQSWDQYITSANGDVFFLVNEFEIGRVYAEQGSVYIEHSGDVTDINDAGEGGVTINISADGLLVNSTGAGGFGPGNPIETNIKRLQITADQDVNVVNYGDLTLGVVTFNHDEIATIFVPHASIPAEPYGIWQRKGDVNIDVGANRLIIEGEILLSEGVDYATATANPTFYGGNVTLIGADVVVGAPVRTGMDANNEGGRIALVPTFEHTKFVVTGYGVDGTALQDPELGRLWVLDQNLLGNLETDNSITIGKPGHTGSLSFDDALTGLGVDLTGAVQSWTFYAGPTTFVSDTTFDDTDTLNLYATGTISGAGTVFGGYLNAESVGGYSLVSEFAHLNILNWEGLVDNFGVYVGNITPAAATEAVITVRNYSGNVFISNTGALQLGEDFGLASFTKDGNFGATAYSPVTVAADIFTIGPGDIALFASDPGDLTVNDGITINAEAGSVYLEAETGDVVFGGGPGWGSITVSGAEGVGIGAWNGAITFNENTHINSLYTTLWTGATDVITINDNSELLLTGTNAWLVSDKVTTLDDGYLAAQLAYLGFAGSVMELNGIDLSAVEQTEFTHGATTITADWIELGETWAYGDLTIEGWLTLHDSLTVIGKLTIGEFGAFNNRNSFANAEITADEIDIDAADITGGIFTAAIHADIDATGDIRESTFIAGADMKLTAVGNLSGVEVTAGNEATVEALDISAAVIIGGAPVSVTATQRIADSQVSTPGAVTLAGANLLNNIVSGGGITATDVAILNIIGGSYTSTDTADLAANNEISSVMVRALGPATLKTTLGDIASATVTGSAATLEAGGSISNASVAATATDAILRAAGSIAESVVTAHNDATLENALIISGNTISAGNDVSVTAVSQISGNVINAHGNAVLTGGGAAPVNLTNNTVGTAGAITAIANINSISGGSYVSGAAASMTAAGDISGVTVQASGDASLQSTGGDIAAATVGGNNVTLAAAGKITSVTAKALLAADLEAAGNIFNAHVSALDIDAESTGGDISASTFEAGNKVVLAAAGELDGLIVHAEGANLLLATDLAIEATAGSWIIGGEYIAELGSIELNATNKNIVGANVVAKQAGAVVTLNAGDEVDGVVVDQLGDIIVTAFGITGGLYISENGDIILTATGQDMSGVYAKAKAGSATLTTTNGFDIIDSTADGHLAALLDSSGAVIDSAAVSATETATITATGNVSGSLAYAAADAASITGANIDNSSVTGATTATLTAAGGLISASAATAGADATLTAAQIAGSVVEALGVATLTAANDVSGTNVTAGGDIAIEATAGSIQGTSALGGGAMILTAGAEIDGSDFTAAGDITVAAINLAASSFISETGTIQVSAVANIVNSALWAKTGEVILAHVTEELDGTTITAATDLTVSATWIAGSNLIAETGTLTVTASVIDGSELLAKQGNADVNAGVIIGSSITAVGDVDIEADAVVGSDVFADNNIIAVFYEIENSTLTAYNTVELYADYVDNVNIFANYGITAEVDEELYGGDWTVYWGDIEVGAYMISGARFTTWGDVRLTTADSISNVSVAATGWGTAALAAGGDITGATVEGGSSVSLYAEGAISNTLADADADAMVYAEFGDITGTTVTAGTWAEVWTAFGDIAGTTVTAGTNAWVYTNDGQIANTLVTAEGGLAVLEAVEGIYGSTVSAFTDAYLNAGTGTISDTGVTAGLTIETYGNIIASNLVASDDITISSAMYADSVTAVSFSGGITADEVDFIVGGEYTALRGAVTLGSATYAVTDLVDATITADTLEAYVSRDMTGVLARVNGQADLEVGRILGSSNLTIGGALNITGTGADTQLANNIIGTVGAITATTIGDAINNTVSTASGLDLSVTGNVVGGEYVAAGRIDVEAALIASASFDSGDLVLLVAAGNIEQVEVKANDDAILDAGAALDSSSIVSDNGQIGLMALQILNSQASAEGGEVWLAADVVNNLNINSQGSITSFGALTAGVDQEISGGEWVSQGGDITVAGNVWKISGTDFNAYGEVGLLVNPTAAPYGLVENVNISALWDATLNVSTEIVNTTVTSTLGDALLVSGAITGGAISAEGLARLTTTSGDVTNTSIEGEVIKVTAFGGISNVEADAEAQADLVSRNGDIFNANVSALDILVDSQAGDITASTFEAVDKIVLKAADEMNGLIVHAQGDSLAAADLAIQATAGTWIVGGEYIAEQGSIEMTTLEKNIVGANIVAKQAAATITLKAGNEVDGVVVDLPNDIFVEAVGITGGLYISENGNISLTATGEDISGVYAKAKEGWATLETKNGYDIIGSTVDAHLAATLISSGEIVDSAAVSATAGASLQAAGDISGSVAYAAEQAASIVSTGGNIDNTSAMAGTTVTLTALQGMISESTATAGTNVAVEAISAINSLLNAQTGYVELTVDIADNVNIYAGGDDVGGRGILADIGLEVIGGEWVTQHGDILVEGALWRISGTDFNAYGNVKITVDPADPLYGYVENVNIMSQWNTTLYAKTMIANSSVTSVIADAMLEAGSISGVEVSAERTATLTTTGGYRGGDLVNTNIEAEKIVAEIADSISGVSADAEVTATLTAGRNISSTSVKTGTEDIEITAGGIIQGSSALSGKDLRLTAGTEIDGSDFTAAGDITVAAVDLAASSFISETGSISVGSVANIIDSTVWSKQGAIGITNVTEELDGSTVSAATNLTLTANWVVGSSLIAENGVLTATANVIDGSELLSKDGDAIVKASRIVDSSISALDPGLGGLIGNVDIEADSVVASHVFADNALAADFMVVENSTLTAYDTIDLTARDVHNVDAFAANGITADVSEELHGGEWSAYAGDITVDAGLISATQFTAGDNVILTADAFISNAGVMATAGHATLTAGSDIVGTTVTAGANARLTAVDNIIGSNVTAGADAFLKADQIAGSTVDAVGFAELDATAIGGTTVAAGAGMKVIGTLAESSLTAQTGNIVIENAPLGITNVTASAGAGAISAVDGIGWVAGGSFIAAGDVSLTTDYTIYDALAEGAIVTLWAKNADNSATGAMANLTVTARDAAHLTAAGDITNSSVIAANAATIDLSGDLNNDTVTANTIAITGLVNLENGSYVAKLASLTVDASGNIEGASFTAERADVVLTADGYIASSTVTAQTDAALTAVQIANTAIATATGDVTFTADDLYNLTVVSAGVIDGAAVAGNLVGGSYVAADSITFDDAATIASASFDSGDVVILIASGNIEQAGVKANDGAILAAGAVIDGATVIANHGDVDMTAGGLIPGAIVNSAVTAQSGAVSLSAVGPVFGSGGAIINTAVAAADDVTLTAGDLDNLTVSSGGAINGAAVVNNIVGGSYVATDAITFDAAALIAGASFDSGADVTLAAAGVIELVNVKANDNATLTSGADINAATVIANHGEASLTAAGFIANTAVEAGDAATLLAGADVSGSSVTAVGDIAIEATAGTIQGTSALGDGAITLTAGAEIDGSDFTAAGDITVAATDLAASSFISEAGKISVGEVANIIDSTLWAKLGEIEITNVTDELDGSTISAATALTLTANWVVGSSLIAENGDLTVTAAVIDGSELLSKDGDAIVAADSIIGSSITALDLNNAGVGNVDIDAGMMTGSDVFAFNEIAAEFFEIENSTLTAYDTVDLHADYVENVDVFANYGITAEVKEELYGGDWTVYSGDITVDAGMISGTRFTAWGDVSLAVDEFIVNAGVAAVSGDATLAAGGDIVGSTVTASGDASLTAVDNILGSTVTSGADAILAADQIAGSTVDAVGFADLSATAIGGATVVAGTGVDVSGTIAESSLTAQTGDIVIAGATLGVTSVTASAGAGDIKATEDIGWVAGGSFIAAGDVELEAAYTIYDALIEGANVILTAANAGDSATGAMASLTVTARDAAILTAAGDITNSSVFAANAATLDLSGDLNNDTVTAGAIAISGLVNIENGSYVARLASLTVDASGDIEGAVFTAEVADVVLSAAGSIEQAGVTANGSATLLAGQVIDGATVVASLGDVTVSAGGLVPGAIVNSAVTAQSGAASLSAVGPVFGAPGAIINTAVAAASDVTLTAGDLDNLTVSSGGAIDGAAVANNIVGGSYVAAAGITFDAAATIASASFDSGAVVTLETVAGNIELVTVKGNDGASLKAAGAIDGSTVIANHNDATLEAAQIIASTVTAQSGDAALTSTGSIIGAIVTAAADATLIGAGQLGNNTIAAGETATLAGYAPGVGGVADLTNNTVLARNIVADSNIRSIIGGVYTSGEDTTLVADIEIGGVTVQATQAASLTTVNGDIVNSSLEGTPVTLNAARHITNVSVDSEAAAILAAGFDVSGASVKARADIEITAAAGSIQGSSALGEAAIKLTAGEEIDGSDFTAAGAITVAATDLAASSFISEAGDISVGAVANIVDSTLWAKLGAIGIANVTDELDGSTVTAATDLTVTAAWIVGSNLIAENGDLTVAAAVIDGSELLSKDGDAIVVAGSIFGSSITALDPNDADVGIVDIEADEVVGSDVFASNDIIAEFFEIESSTLTAYDTIELHADYVDNVDVFANYGITAEIYEELYGGDWTVYYGDLTVDAYMISGTEFTARGDVSLTADEFIINAGVAAVSGAATLAAGDILGATVTASGAASLTAAGVITTSTVAANTVDVTAALISESKAMAGDAIAASGSLSNSSLTAGGNIVLANAAAIDNLDAVSAGAITAVNAIGAITGGSLVSDGATTVSAASIRGTAFDAATADLTASSDIQAILARVGTSAKLSSASIVDSNVLVSQAGGSIEVKATAIDGGSLRADEVTFDEFVADADAQVGAASAVKVLGAEAITVANGGLVNIVSENDQDTTFTVAASGDVFLTQGNGDMRVDILADGQTVTLTAAADILGAVAGADVTAKNLIITTAQNVTLDTTIEQVKADVAYDFTLKETDDLAVDLVSAGRKAVIDVGGSLLDSANDAILDIVTPELSLKAAGSIGAAGNALEVSAQKLTASATAGLINLLNVSDQNVTVSNLLAGTSVTFKAQGSGAHTFKGSVTANDGDVVIDSAAGDLVFANLSTVTASNDAAIAAYGDLSTEGIVFLEATAGDLDLASAHGTIDLGSGTIAKAGADLTLVALENDVFASGTLEAGDDIVIDAEGWVRSDAVMLAGEDVDIYAYEEVILKGAVTAAGGEVFVFAETGDLVVDAPVTAATDISLETMDDVINVNAPLTAASVWLASEKGDILSSHAGAITAGTIAAETGGKVNLAGKLAASDWVAIEAVGSVTAADIESGEVAVQTTGANADITINLTALATDLVARADGIDADIFIQGRSLDLIEVYAYDGDVNVDATGAVDVFMAQALDEGEVNGIEDDAHSVFIRASSLNVRAGAIIADYDADFDLGGDGDFASHAVLVGNDITITAPNGSIQDASNTDEYNLIASGDITLLVGNRIGDPAGRNPFDVSAGGKVNVGAIDGAPLFTDSNSKDRIWVFMMGKSGDGSINYVGDTSTPPGLIWWNGMIWGGPEDVLLDIDRAEGGFSREVRDLADRYISSSWFYNYLYFPHVRAYLDEDPGSMSIEHILDGEGVIEGLPEGVTPTEFNLNDLDDSYTWYDGSK